MEIKNKNIHKIGVLITLILFLTATVVSFSVSRNVYMGAKFISAQQLAQYRMTEEAADTQILFNGEPAAVDTITKTVYISQNITENTTIKDLKGAFTASNPAYTVKLVEDTAYENLYTAVQSGHKFTLVLCGKDNCAVQYSLVYTSLPVISVNGNVTGTDEEGRELFNGSFGFWDSHSAESGEYRTQSGCLEWHVRGQTSSAMAKKPWKLSIKNSKGNNQNISLCGLGEDDDWILNPMNLDDMKIREKLAMELWNTFNTDKQVSMSAGEYVEVVINGEYKGLYLLQRRLDEKYLDLDKSDILLKGAEYVPVLTGDSLEIVYSPYSNEKTTELLNGIFPEKYQQLFNTENLVLNNMFITFGNMYDNLGTKNVYWLVENIETDCTVKMILWDTDMSFAIALNNKFVYALDYSIKELKFRSEWEELTAADESLNTLAAEKWFALRETLFTQQEITRMMDGYLAQMTDSGALQRDRDQWGLYYEGKDNYENFILYLEGRFKVLDKYYGAFLK